MRFVCIDPAKKTVIPVNVEDLLAAEAVVGLDWNKVDHGMIRRDLAIVVFEFGMYVPINEAHFFSIGTSLFVGGAVLYGVNEIGDTVDVQNIPPVLFYRDAKEVERAITAGQILRPMLAVNGEVLWQWPDKAPKGMPV